MLLTKSTYDVIVIKVQTNLNDVLSLFLSRVWTWEKSIEIVLKTRSWMAHWIILNFVAEIVYTDEKSLFENVNLGCIREIL